MLSLLPVAALALLSSSNTELERARAYIQSELDRHCIEFLSNDSEQMAGFFERNCVVGFKMLDARGGVTGYRDYWTSFRFHNENFGKNLERQAKLLRLEENKDGFVGEVFYSWKAQRKGSDTLRFSRTLVQQQWVKTRSGYGLKLIETLLGINNMGGAPMKYENKNPKPLWNGFAPAPTSGELALVQQ